MNYEIKDIKLAKKGKLRIEWADTWMPVLRSIRKRFKKQKPLKGVTIASCQHLTCATANLLIALKEGGAKVVGCASNPLSTEDDVTASLVKDYKIPTFGVRGVKVRKYYQHINKALGYLPNITIDDGADLASVAHKKGGKLLNGIIGGTEETTTGVIRFKAMQKDGALKFPIIAVNDSKTKHLFDNRFGTGQSSIDGILRATNILIPGKNFVVIGFGWCGRGVAQRARGAGANVIVCEVDPVKALEALMEGYRVMPLIEAVEVGDVFITVTGGKHNIDREHFNKMKDGTIVCNTGHFNVEFNIPYLEKTAKKKRKIKEEVMEYTLKGGKKLYVLAEGRLVNLAVADGHPDEVMDMSFANQALAAEYLLVNKGKLEDKVYTLPSDIDTKIAGLKLKSMGVKIDKLTKEQKKYLSSWEEGT